MKGFELLAALAAEVCTGKPLAPTVALLDQHIFDAAEFDDAVFDGIAQCLSRAEFAVHPDAMSLLKLFDDHGELLRVDQRQRLHAALTTMFPMLKDDLAAFLAIELLVASSDSQPAALNALRQLAAHSDASRLPLVVHGYDWLCKKSQGDVRADCLAQLTRLAASADAALAAEAAAALRRRSRGGP